MSIVKQQHQATQTPQRKPLVSFEEWQKKQVLVHENDYSRHNSKRKSNTASSNRQQMVDSVDGGFSDDFGSMFEGSNVHMDMPDAQDKIIEPSNNKKATTGHSRTKFGDLRMKSLKERFNYASTDCAATVRKANKEAKGANAILYESKDQYLLNKCSADNKFVIINLCEPIRIDTIVMANYEFFSSTFKDFRIYVADRYPSKDWQLLGQWQARNTRDLQVFRVDDKSGWPEYIKIEFISHYGQEYYCPLSLVRVYGMSMMEYYNRVERQGLSDDDNDGDENGLEDEHLWPADVREQIIQPQFDITNSSESLSVKHQSHDDEDDEDDDILEEVVIKPVVLDSTDSIKSKNNNQHTINDDVPESNRNNNDNNREAENIKETGGESVSASVKSIEYPEINNNNMITTKEKTKTIVIDDPQVSTFDVENKNQPVSVPSSSLSEKPSTESPSLPISSSVTSSFIPSSSQGEVSQSMESSQTSKNSDHSQESDFSTSPSQQSESPSSSSSSSVSTSSKVSANDKDSSSVASTISPESSSNDSTSEEVATPPSSSDINKDGAISGISSESTTTTTTTTTTNQEFEKSTTTITSSSTEEVRQASKIVVVPKEKSTTQESIYKTIMKRLNALEVNATLSQRYLDEQNKMLNDVFLDMEKRHQEQLMMLIGHLNETASHKIDSMKRRYEKWYDDLKDQTETDMRDMTAKISILADQLSFERRVSLTQLIIIITIFVFMALSRGTFSTLSPVMAAREEERKKLQSAKQAGVLLSTISHSLKPSKNEALSLPPTKPENPRRHSDDPYFTMNLQEQRPRGLSTSSTTSKKDNQALPDETNQIIKNEDNTTSLVLGISNTQSYEGLNIELELEPELLSQKLNDVLLKQQQPNEQTVPSSSTQYNDNLLLSDEEDENNTK